MTAVPNTMPIPMACTGPNGAACAGPFDTAYTGPIDTVDWHTGGEPFRIVPTPPSHPEDARLSGVYGTVFTEEAAAPVERPDSTWLLHHPNVTVFADGQVDRSPCGSGTAARVALLAGAGELRLGDELRHESVVGSVFRARTARSATVQGRPAVVPAVTGTAYATGASRFTVDPDDTLVPGFVPR